MATNVSTTIRKNITLPLDVDWAANIVVDFNKHGLFRYTDKIVPNQLHDELPYGPGSRFDFVFNAPFETQLGRGLETPSGADPCANSDKPKRFPAKWEAFYSGIKESRGTRVRGVDNPYKEATLELIRRYVAYTSHLATIKPDKYQGAPIRKQSDLSRDPMDEINMGIHEGGTRTVHTSTGYIAIAFTLHRHLMRDEVCDPRHIYYEVSEFFPGTNGPNLVLRDLGRLAVTMGVPRGYFNVVAGKRGKVYGRGLCVVTVDGKRHYGSDEGTDIPENACIVDIFLHPVMEGFVMPEAAGMGPMLISLLDKYVVIPLGGQTSLDTKYLLNRAWRKHYFDTVFGAVTDRDVEGMEIGIILTRGSRASIHQGAYMAVPDAHPVGITPQSMEAMKELPDGMPAIPSDQISQLGATRATKASCTFNIDCGINCSGLQQLQKFIDDSFTPESWKAACRDIQETKEEVQVEAVDLESLIFHIRYDMEELSSKLQSSPPTEEDFNTKLSKVLHKDSEPLVAHLPELEVPRLVIINDKDENKRFCICSSDEPIDNREFLPHSDGSVTVFRDGCPRLVTAKEMLECATKEEIKLQGAAWRMIVTILADSNYHRYAWEPIKFLADVAHALQNNQDPVSFYRIAHTQLALSCLLRVSVDDPVPFQFPQKLPEQYYQEIRRSENATKRARTDLDDPGHQKQLVRPRPVGPVLASTPLVRAESNSHLTGASHPPTLSHANLFNAPALRRHSAASTLTYTPLVRKGSDNHPTSTSHPQTLSRGYSSNTPALVQSNHSTYSNDTAGQYKYRSGSISRPHAPAAFNRNSSNTPTPVQARVPSGGQHSSSGDKSHAPATRHDSADWI